MYKIYTTFIRPSKDVPFYHERTDMFPVINTAADITQSSSNVAGREVTLSDDELTYTVTMLFANKQAWMAYKYELMKSEVMRFVERNAYCLENNIDVVREWSDGDGPRHLADDSNLDQYARLFFNIKDVISKVGDNPCLVTFDIEPIDGLSPILEHTYTVLCDGNSSYDGTFICESATATTITLSYPSDPGEFLVENGQYENAISSVTMNP